MVKIHTILFDAGDTLVQAGGFFPFLAKAMGDESLSVHLKVRFFPLMHGKEFFTIKDMWVQICAEMVDECGARPIDAKAVYADYFINNSRVFPETIEVLEALRARGIKLVLVSDADADVLRESFDKLGLTQYFDGMVISSEQRGYKPGPEMVAATHQYCSVPFDGVLFVGDMDVDMRMAECLGVRGVLVDRDGLQKYAAPVRIRSLRELYGLLENS